MVPKYYLVAFG